MPGARSFLPLGRTSRRGAAGLAEHEVLGRLVWLEFGHSRGDVGVAVEDEQVVRFG